VQLTVVRPKAQPRHSAAALRSWLWPLVIVLSSIGVSVVVWGDVHSPVRPLLTFWFLCLCPGMAFVRLLDCEQGYIQMTLTIALSLVLDTAVATALLYAHQWSPAHTLELLVGLSLVGVALDVTVAHRRRRTASRSTVPFVALPGMARPVPHTSRHAMEKLITAVRVCPPNEQVTVAVPPLPRDSMGQVQPTTPLLPTVRAEPSNDRGARPVE
jgi:uncharacterized membrane protein